MPSLVDLPPELLDKIWGYLDWDRTVFLTPSYESRESIFAISLTCTHLRNQVLPTLFRHVVLALRCDGGEFLVPSLVYVCQRPHLAKHINCVHIKAADDPNTYDNRKALPNDIANSSQLHKTIDAAPKWDCHEELLREHRESVSQALRIFQAEPLSARTNPPQVGSPVPRQPLPASSVQPSMTDQAERDESPVDFYLHAPAQAFCLAAVCFPPTLKQIVFDGTNLTTQGPRVVSMAFGMLFVALEVFKNRLESITMLAQSSGVSHAMDELSIHYDEGRRQGLSRLRKIRSLTFAASTSSFKFQRAYNTVTLSSQGCFHWHQVPDTVRHLDLRNLRVDAGLHDPLSAPATLLRFIQGFPGLQSLSLANIALCRSSRLARSTVREVIWLEFLIDLRNLRASLALELGDLYFTYEDHGQLPVSCVRWLLEQAVPIEAVIDQERAYRLAEDFASFLFLWKMEDSEAGANAAADPSRETLVDVAMTNRALRFR